MKSGEIEHIIHKLDDDLSNPQRLGIQELLRCIELCTRSYQNIKAKIQNVEFETIEAEINFFKYIKPKVTSKYFYHLKLYKIETSVPISSTEVKIKYYKEQIQKLDNYNSNHQEFCIYIKRNATYMDHIYFTRGNKSPELFANYQFIEIGHEFATSHGFVLARILANEKLYTYISKKLQLLEHSYAEVDNIISPVKWKGSKINLVVLMYGLVESGQVDCDIAALADQFQKVFNIELKDTYRMWSDVKTRKKELFPWLNEMKRRLEKRAREE